MRNRVEGAFTLKGLKVLNFASNFDELHFLKGKNFTFYDFWTNSTSWPPSV
jgi:hypothetical protein